MTDSDFNDIRSPGRGVPASLRIAATSLRTVFIVLLGIATLRVAAPERETLFTAYVKWGDLVRLALGSAVCVWLAMQLFKGPESEKGYRVWLYTGLVGIPFGLICLVATW